MTSFEQVQPADVERASNGDEDDNISIASTILSQQQEEYEVETILAQGTFPEGIRYLVKWVGYSEDRCTWEPTDSFHDLQTLRDWRKKRSAIDRGETAPFDVEAWEKRIQDLENARRERKRRRMTERILPNQEGHGQRHNDDERLQFSKRDNKLSAGQSNRGTSNSDDTTGKSARAADIQKTLATPPKQPGIELLPESLHEVERDNSADQARLPSSRLQNGITDGKPSNKEPKTPDIGSGGRGTVQELFATPTARASQTRLAGTGRPEITSKGKTALAKRSVSNPSAQSAARSSSKPVEARQQKGKKEAPRSPPSPKVFGNLSTQRRLWKVSHHEPAPDINQLELRRPSDWSSVPNSSAVASFAGRDQRKRKLSEERPLISPESEKLPVPRRRSDFDTHRDRVRPEAQQSSHQRKWSLDSSHDSPLSPRTTRSIQQHEPRAYGRHIPSAPAAQSSSRDFGMGTRKGVADPFRNRSRVIEQIPCSISYGPKGIDVGDVRICGLSPSPRRKMTDMGKGRNVLIWFQHLCTLGELELLSKGRNLSVCNAWIEGFDDTMPLLDRLAAYLREKDLIAIYYLPNDQQSTVFLLYPTGSVTFGFLDCRSRVPHGVALRVAVRDRFFTFDHLLSASPTNASHPQLPGTRESLKDISTLSCSDSPEKPKPIKAQHPSRPSHPQLPIRRRNPNRSRHNIHPPVRLTQRWQPPQMEASLR
ncbi:hypothetical protein Egran_03847 [Elaphomyces granulatus]|uniref:Chromo domain-containing protein n=1 Tax=Elaphomyces granulatus TaxID=519963 RepID=A0A232LW38_9EURO|nr:hypothetical protein Egran_03847 [Elaphomyces granulatus]